MSRSGNQCWVGWCLFSKKEQAGKCRLYDVPRGLWVTNNGRSDGWSSMDVWTSCPIKYDFPSKWHNLAEVGQYYTNLSEARRLPWWKWEKQNQAHHIHKRYICFTKVARALNSQWGGSHTLPFLLKPKEQGWITVFFHCSSSFCETQVVLPIVESNWGQASIYYFVWSQYSKPICPNTKIELKL